MLNNKINVVLWDQPVGKLYWDDSQTWTSTSMTATLTCAPALT